MVALLRRIEDGVLVVCLSLLALLPLVDMLGRPLGGLHLSGSAVYVQQLTLWLAFLGGLLATREEKHLTLSTTEFLGEGRLRHLARLLTWSLAAAVCAVLAYANAALVAANRQQGKLLPGGIPAWISESVMPLALALMVLRFTWGASPRWRERALPVLMIAVALGGVGLTEAGHGLMPEQAAGWALPVGLLIVAVSLLGAPIFVIMGGLALLLFFKDGTPVAAVSAEVYRLISSPTLPAIPLLTACGYVLAAGHASERLLRFFRALFGWMPGGLAVMVTGVCALFTTFTGGSGVTIIALGGLVYPMLKKDRYPEDFSLGLVTAAGSLGLLFPPSLPVILYSVVASTNDANVPADSLYIAGILPGFLMMMLVAAYGVWVGRRTDTPRQAFSIAEVGRSAWAAKWELALPLVVIALFASGTASMLETAAFAVAYAVVTQCLIARDVHLFRQLPQALLQACALMGAVLILLSVAMGLTSYMVDAQIAEALLDWVKAHVHSQALFLLALNGLLLIVGCLIDIFSAIVVVVPLIAPLGAAFGVDPLHLGIIFLANLELGFLTPPVGMNLFLSSSRFGKPLLQVYRDTLPFLLILSVGVLLITYVPGLSLGLVHLLVRAPQP